MGAHHAVGAVVLRAVLAVLILANLGLFALGRGWLDGVSGAPGHAEHEPDRLARQVRPESIRILPPAGSGMGASPAESRTPSAPAASAPGPATAPASAGASAAATASNGTTVLGCLQAGPFTPTEVGKVEAALQSALPALAPGYWTNVKIETPGIWLVYMGKYADREALLAKQEELRRFRNLSFEEVQGAPALEPGLSLGRYDSRSGAEAALARLVERGVRTARVVALSPPAVVHTLRVERVDASLKAQLLGLPPAVLAGTAFAPCPAPGAPAASAAS
jgi:hypothetical protein